MNYGLVHWQYKSTSILPRKFSPLNVLPHTDLYVAHLLDPYNFYVSPVKDIYHNQKLQIFLLRAKSCHLQIFLLIINSCHNGVSEACISQTTKLMFFKFGMQSCVYGGHKICKFDRNRSTGYRDMRC